MSVRTPLALVGLLYAHNKLTTPSCVQIPPGLGKFGGESTTPTHVRTLTVCREVWSVVCLLSTSPIRMCLSYLIVGEPHDPRRRRALALFEPLYNSKGPRSLILSHSPSHFLRPITVASWDLVQSLGLMSLPSSDHFYCPRLYLKHSPVFLSLQFTDITFFWAYFPATLVRSPQFTAWIVEALERPQVIPHLTSSNSTSALWKTSSLNIYVRVKIFWNVHFNSYFTNSITIDSG